MISHSVAAVAEGDPRAELEMSDELGRKIIRLSRRWADAGVKGKGITLAGHELDLLNAVGIGRLVMSAAADEQMSQAIERQALRSRTSPMAQLSSPAVAVAADPDKPDSDVRCSATSGELQKRELDTVDQPVPTPTPVDRRGDSLLRIPEVRRRTGLFTATIHRRVNEKTFPPKVRLGPACVAWYLSDIEVFVADPTSYRAG